MENHHIILVVEDDEGLNHLIQNTLQTEGFQTQGVFNGAEAVATALNKEITLIMLDYSLPDMSGYNIIKTLQEKNCTTPFIVLTGQGNEEVAVEMLKLGAKEYVIKDGNLLNFLPVLINKVLNEIAREKAYADIELALQEKSYLNQVILDSMPCITLLIQAHSFEIIESNAAAAKTNAVSGKRCYETWGRRNEPCPWCRASDMWESGRKQHIEIEYSGKILDMYWIPIDKDMYLHYAFDITDRRKLEKTIIEVEERERMRIGKDLHDELGQLLTGISFKTEVLRKKVEKEFPSKIDDVEEINSLIGKAKDYTRLLSKGLLSTVIQEDNLMLALNNLAADAEKIYGISCNLVYDKHIQIYYKEAIIHLYRIAQEAITNAIKHGNSDQIIINVSKENDEVVLVIKDNGTGIPKTIDIEKNLGLQIMNYRANLIGATLQVEQDINGDTLVSCFFNDKSNDLETD